MLTLAVLAVLSQKCVTLGRITACEDSACEVQSRRAGAALAAMEQLYNDASTRVTSASKGGQGAEFQLSEASKAFIAAGVEFCSAPYSWAGQTFQAIGESCLSSPCPEAVSQQEQFERMARAVTCGRATVQVVDRKLKFERATRIHMPIQTRDAALSLVSTGSLLQQALEEALSPTRKPCQDDPELRKQLTRMLEEHSLLMLIYEDLWDQQIAKDVAFDFKTFLVAEGGAALAERVQARLAARKKLSPAEKKKGRYPSTPPGWPIAMSSTSPAPSKPSGDDEADVAEPPQPPLRIEVTELHSAKGPTSHAAPLVMPDDTVIIPETKKPGALLFFGRHGKKASFKGADLSGESIRPVALDAQTIAIADDTHVWLVTPEGRLIWKAELEGKATSAVALSNGWHTLAVATDRNVVHFISPHMKLCEPKKLGDEVGPRKVILAPMSNGKVAALSLGPNSDDTAYLYFLTSGGDMAPSYRSEFGFDRRYEAPQPLVMPSGDVLITAGHRWTVVDRDSGEFTSSDAGYCLGVRDDLADVGRTVLCFGEANHFPDGVNTTTEVLWDRGPVSLARLKDGTIVVGTAYCRVFVLGRNGVVRATTRLSTDENCDSVHVAPMSDGSVAAMVGFSSGAGFRTKLLRLSFAP